MKIVYLLLQRDEPEEREETVDLLSVKDVAEKLGVSAPTVIRLADAGELAAVEMAKRTGRRFLRFKVEEVEKFISEHEKKTEL